MDNIAGLFSPNGGQGLKSMDKENHIQGLFYDLLSCLAGGDHPRLPPDYKETPMTGFCDILDAFNETIKVREAGSGIVCEIDSSAEVMSNRTSDETLKSSDKESGQALHTDSNKSFCSSNELPARGADSSQSNSSIVKQRECQLAFFNRLSEKILSTESILEDQKQKQQNQVNDNEPSDAENYEDAFDFDGPNPILSMLKTSFLESVGPTLTLSPSQQSSLVRPVSAMSDGKPELNEYSDELKNVERLLMESIPNVSEFLRREFPKGGMSAGALIGNGILPLSSFPNPIMNASDVLERIYDAESSKSSCHPQTSHHVSTYQSCTSIPHCFQQKNAENPSDSILESLPASTVKRSPSIYKDCVHLTETLSDADFIAALDAELIEEEGAGRAYGNAHTASNEDDAYRAMLANMIGLREPSGMYLGEDEVNGNDKSAPYYSVGEDSGDEQELQDADNDKQKKQKRKTRLQRAKTGLAAKEWTWASASDSGSVDKY